MRRPVGRHTSESSGSRPLHKLAVLSRSPRPNKDGSSHQIQTTDSVEPSCGRTASRMRKLRVTKLRVTLGCACALVFLINATQIEASADSGTDRALVSSSSSFSSSLSSSDSSSEAGVGGGVESVLPSTAPVWPSSSSPVPLPTRKTVPPASTTPSTGPEPVPVPPRPTAPLPTTTIPPIAPLPTTTIPPVAPLPTATMTPTDSPPTSTPSPAPLPSDPSPTPSQPTSSFPVPDPTKIENVTDVPRPLPVPTSLPSPSTTNPDAGGGNTISEKPSPGRPNIPDSPSPSYFDGIDALATPAPLPTRDEDERSPSPPPRQIPPPAPPINLSRSPSQTAGPQPSSPRTPPPPAGNGGGVGGSNKENRESTESPATSAPGSSTSPLAVSGRDPTATSNTPAPTPVATPAPTPKRYRRGDDVIIVTKEENGMTVINEVVVAPSQSPAVVVRDADQTTQNNNDNNHHHNTNTGNNQDTNGNNNNSAGATTGETGSASGNGNSDRVYIFLQYLCSSLAFASLVLLVGFHFVALQPAATLSMSSVRGSVVALLSRPNQWELLVFISYIQALGACAHYVVWAAPQFFWKFADAFSWTAFLPFHFNGSGISYVASIDTTRRRLVEIVVLDGFVAFADRIGVNEGSLLKTCVVGFLVVGGVLLLVALAVGYFTTFHQDDDFESETSPVNNLLDCAQVLPHEPLENTTRRPVWIVQGLSVIVAAFAVYPLVAIATFEIVSQIRASKVSSGALTIALATLFGACTAFIACALASIASAQDTRHSYRQGVQYRAVWGSLGSGDWIQYKWRVVFASAWLTVQLLSAIVVGAVRSEAWQLGLLIAVNVAFMATVASTRPFSATATARLAMVATYSLTSVKIVNTALALAFLSPLPGGSTTGHRRAVATAFIVVNCIIIVLWFTRLFGMACRLARDAWDNRRRSRKNTDASSTFQQSTTPNSTRHQDSQYVAMPSKGSGNGGRR